MAADEESDLDNFELQAHIRVKLANIKEVFGALVEGVNSNVKSQKAFAEQVEDEMVSKMNVR
jgi:hypothetical protein